MTKYDIPEMLQGLWDQEDKLRQKAVELVAQDKRLQLHLVAIECAMNLAYVFRQFPTDDEDIKVVRVLGMRMFNAFGSSTKLGLSGYSQNSALIMRDVLETVFLLDLFKDDKKNIEQWRLAGKHERMRDFRPVAVRKALDARDGFTEKKAR